MNGGFCLKLQYDALCISKELMDEMVQESYKYKDKW
jgi:hypothetical protein